MLCDACKKKTATEYHHKFSNTDVNRKLYPEFIDHEDNLQLACNSCNGSHAGQGSGLVTWSEIEFCNHFGIRPRSKSMQFRNLQDLEDNL